MRLYATLLIIVAGAFPFEAWSAKPRSKSVHTGDAERPAAAPPNIPEPRTVGSKPEEAKASPGKIETVTKSSNLTTKRYIDARYLDKEFAARKTSALKGKGQMIIDIALAANIDPVFFASAICFESGWGTSYKIRTNNNPGGVTGGGAYRKFKTLEEGLREMAKVIRENYVDKDINTVAGLAWIYARPGAKNDPGGTNKNWPRDVSSIMNKIIRNSSSFKEKKAK